MSEIEACGQGPEFAAFVGIDWTDQKHVWYLQGRDSAKRESGELKHTPEALKAWVVQLLCLSNISIHVKASNLYSFRNSRSRCF